MLTTSLIGVLSCQSLTAQIVDIVDSLDHLPKMLSHKSNVSSVPVVLHAQIDKLSVAVMLGGWVCAALIDTAGHLTRGIKVTAKPFDKLTHLTSKAKL